MRYERAPVTKCKSRIDGKLISIRHAVEGDLLYIQTTLKESGSPSEPRDYSEYVVAEQEGKLLGFGIVTVGDNGMGVFTVYVDSAYGFLAEEITKHLSEYPVR